ncbi:hypothetical protein [uncultured Shewanella sp.]|uniref:hypothetical protein n=1 Tax=uncultured Shewanella sp. TaxID=173975 RepID=UPI002602079C|nr:hypothetical protein [uncultured Shewanella sp.]
MKAYAIFCCLFLVVSSNISAKTTSIIPTPFESSPQSTLPTSKDIALYLQKIVKKSPEATLVQLGKSAGDRPIYGVRLSKDPQFLKNGLADPNKLTGSKWEIYEYAQ